MMRIREEISETEAKQKDKKDKRTAKWKPVLWKDKERQTFSQTNEENKR